MNSLVVNYVPLSIIMYFGTPNLYMITLMNSTALATVIEAAGFTSIHFMNLSTSTKMYVNPPLAFLNRPTRSMPHVEKGQVIGMVYNWWDITCFYQAKNWQLSHQRTKELSADTVVDQKNPCLYVFPTSGLALMWLPQIPARMSWKMAHPSSGVMHFIRVPLALHQKSSSFNRVYCPALWHNHSCSTLSFGKPPVLRYINNGVCQSEWILVTLGDSDMLSFCGRVSYEDAATLLALAKALEMLGSWSS
jgi:hypothetical protein